MLLKNKGLKIQKIEDVEMRN